MQNKQFIYGSARRALLTRFLRRAPAKRRAAEHAHRNRCARVHWLMLKRQVPLCLNAAECRYYAARCAFIRVTRAARADGLWLEIGSIVRRAL